MPTILLISVLIIFNFFNVISTANFKTLALFEKNIQVLADDTDENPPPEEHTDNSNDKADDGESLDSQKDENGNNPTKDMFESVYGDQASQAWKEEHNRAISGGGDQDQQQEAAKSDSEKRANDAYNAAGEAQKELEADPENPDLQEKAKQAWDKYSEAQRDFNKFQNLTNSDRSDEKQTQESASQAGLKAVDQGSSLDDAIKAANMSGANNIRADQRAAAIATIVQAYGQKNGLSQSEIITRAREESISEETTRGRPDYEVAGAAAIAVQTVGGNAEDMANAAILGAQKAGASEQDQINAGILAANSLNGSNLVPLDDINTAGVNAGYKAAVAAGMNPTRLGESLVGLNSTKSDLEQKLIDAGASPEDAKTAAAAWQAWRDTNQVSPGEVITGTNPDTQTLNIVSPDLKTFFGKPGIVTPQQATTAQDILTQLYPDRSLDNNSYEYQLVTSALKSGLSQDDILAQNTVATKLFDYMKTHAVDLGDGTYQFQPPGSDAPQDIQDSWNTLRYYSGITGFVTVKSLSPDTLNALQDKLLPSYLTGLVAQKAGITNYQTQISKARSNLSGLIDYAKANGIDTSSFPQVSTIMDENKIMIMPAKNSNLEGYYDGSTKTFVIYSNTGGAKDPEVYVHEAIHKAADLANPSYGQWANDNLNDGDNPLNAKKLWEGLTETATQIANEIASRQSFTGHYDSSVGGVRNELVTAIMQNSNVSLDRAQAILVQAAVGGKYQEFVQAVGGGDLEKGKKIVKEKLAASGSSVLIPPDQRLFSDFLALTDFIVKPVSAASETSVKTNGVDDIVNGVITPLDVSMAYAAALKDLKTNNSPKNTNLQTPIAISSNLEQAIRNNLLKQAQQNSPKVDNQLKNAISTKDLFPQQAIKTLTGYTLITGKQGIVSSNIEQGKYRLEMIGITNYDASVPAEVSISQNPQNLDIYIKPGSGKIEKLTRALNQQSFAGSKQDNVYLRFFLDSNNNKQFDKGEPVIPLAGIKVNLINTGQQKVKSSDQKIINNTTNGVANPSNKTSPTPKTNQQKQLSAWQFLIKIISDGFKNLKNSLHI